MVTVRQVQTNSMWSLITFGTSFVFSAIFTVILPNVLAVEQYGEYGYYFRVFSWIGSLGVLFIPVALFRYLPELESLCSGNKPVVQQLLLYCFKRQMLVSLVVMVAGACYLWFERETFGNSNYIIAGTMILVASWLMTVQALGRSYLEGLQQYRKYARIGFISSLTKITALVVLLVLGLKSAVNCFSVIMIEQFVMVVLVTLVVIKQWYPGKGCLTQYRSVLDRMGDYGLSMGVGSGFSLITWGYVEVFMIKALYRGSDVMEQLGYYCLAISLSTILVRIMRNITNPLTTFFVHHCVKGNLEVVQRAVKKSMVFTMLFGGGAMFLLFLFSADIFSLFFPIDMEPARMPLLILLIPSFALVLTLPLGSLQFAFEQQKFLMWSNIVAAIINLILDLVIIPTHGAIGAALINAVVQSLACFSGMVYLLISKKMVMPYWEIVKILLIFAVTGVVCYCLDGICGKILNMIITVFCFLGCISLSGLVKVVKRNGLVPSFDICLIGK